jgi:hypothetical protein
MRTHAKGGIHREAIPTASRTRKMAGCERHPNACRLKRVLKVHRCAFFISPQELAEILKTEL